MAIQITVTQSGGKVRVYANNQGNVAIIDRIVLTIQFSSSTWHVYKYQDDFYFGSGRISGGVWLMFAMNYASGPAQASAKAYYWEVDQMAASPVTNLS